ncbi:MAG: hypothetical protein Q9181_007249 [Wetmoreana brouardii]
MASQRSLLLLPFLVIVLFCCKAEPLNVNGLVSNLGLTGDPAKTVSSIAAQATNVKVSPVQRATLACKVSKVVFTSVSTAGGSTVPQYLDHSSQQYINRTEINWSSSCWKESQCILSPPSAQGISQAMLIVNFFGSKFATRSGGHSTNVGFANVDDYGALIDVVNLNQITHNQKTISIGSGQRWGQVYDYLNNTGVIAIGGRSPEVGVGGLMLGGGMPYFSSLYGIVSDGAQEYEIVLANSSIVRANPQQNTDLFKALKGGGSNFGIVTKFSVDAIPSTPFWFEARTYNPKQTVELFQALVKYQAAAENDIHANLVFSIGNGATLVGFVYAKPVVRPPVYSPFYNIPFNMSFINSTIDSPQALVKAFSSVGGTVVARYNTCSATLKPDLNSYEQSYANWVAISTKAAKDFGAIMTYGVQPFTSTAAKHGDLKGGNALGLDKVSQSCKSHLQSQFVLSFSLMIILDTGFAGTVQWNSSTDDATAQQTLLSVCNAVRDAATANAASLSFLFMNDANYAQDVLGSYGAVSKAQLKAVARKYDPQGLFQSQQNNGFLLTKSS